MSVPAALWAVFGVIVLGMISLDLGVLSRRPRIPSTRGAVLLSLVWVLLAMLFGAGVWYGRGPESGLAFFTGYILEQALSVDNIFVFLLIFRSLRVPPQLEPKILKWGILGALAMRAFFIVAGVALLQLFHWVSYVFGGFIIWTGLRILLPQSRAGSESGALLRFVRKRLPVADTYAGDAFIVRQGGRWRATPLLLALAVVEVADVIFAIDSIPAVLAVTTDPFVVYTSNIFAILGLRTLYFLLANVVELFRYLKVGLGIVLAFAGVKMILRGVYEIPNGIALGVVASVLLASVLASIVVRRDGDVVLRDPPGAAGE